QTLNARRRGELGTCAYRVLIAGGSEPVLAMVARLGRASDAIVPTTIAVPDTQIASVRQLGLPAIPLSDDDPESVLHLAREHGIDGGLFAPGPGVADTTLRRLARVSEWASLRLLYAPTVVDVATSAPVIPV